MQITAIFTVASVHCRIGSSEKRFGPAVGVALVHCRIGSSEIDVVGSCCLRKVHCRIGSSEKADAYGMG